MSSANRLALIATLVSLPAAALAVRALILTAADLANPCVRWDPKRQADAVVIGPDSPCRFISVRGESELRAITVAVVVPGGVLFAAAAAIAAAQKRSRRLMSAAAAVMLAETLAVFTIAPLTLMAGIAFLVISRRLHG